MRSRRRRGMSLVEMMFVLAILGVLMAIGTGAYRRMQVNNLFTTDVQKLGGELRNLSGVARSFGMIQAGLAPSNNEALRGEVQGPAGGWIWKTLQRTSAGSPPVEKAKGTIGQRQTVFARWSNAYAHRGALNQGVWLEMGPANGAPLMQVIFEPDGTPLDAGSIVLRNATTTYTITVTRLGAIEGPK